MNRTTAERVQLRKERNQTIVRAKVSENFQAGLGVASVIVGGSILVYTFTNWAALRPPLPIVGIATGAGAVWFGVLSVIRFSLDEVRDLYQWLKLQETAAGYFLKIQQLTADNTELKRELRKLQSQVRTQEFNQISKGAREVVKTMDKYDALRKNIDDILQRWSQGLKYGRDDVTMTRQEWEAAMRCLDSAGVLGIDDKNPRKRIIIAESLTQAQKRVDTKIETWERFDATTFTPA
jgi:cell division protein FtsB